MIETARLHLRSWREQDRAPFIAMCQSPLVMACLGGPISAQQADAAIARVRACEAANNFCFWAMERKADGAFLGFCGLKVADTVGTPIEDEIEIGWRLRGDMWGQGYAREAALASLDWAWANIYAPRVIAMTVAANGRSQRLMERIGMSRRPDLDFGHPLYSDDHPLHRHIVYAAERPGSAHA